MKKRILILLMALVLLMGIVACTPATEDSTGSGSTEEGIGDFPNKNITWIVPATAGAPVDVPTRAIIENMDIDTNVIVENIAGASNTIGAMEADNRPADGYTILTGTSSSFILQPLMSDLSYDPADFRVISLLKPLGTYCVVVAPDSPLADADKWAEIVNSGERFTYTTSNAGSASHLAIIDTLGKMESTTGVYVPYNGGAEVTGALLNGEVDFAILDSPSSLQQDALGDIKVLLILNDEPEALAPDMPIIADYGVEGMNIYYSIQCIAMHKDTPDEIVEFVKGKINDSIMSDNYKQYLIDAGVGEMEIIDEDILNKQFAETREVYGVMLKDLGMID